jgi:hypothetical protein
LDGKLRTLERYKNVKNLKENLHNIIQLQGMWYTASTVKETVTDQMVDTGNMLRNFVIFNTAFLYSVLSYPATVFKEFYDAFVSMKASKEHQGEKSSGRRQK